MEPQEMKYYNDCENIKKEPKRRNCFEIIAIILVTALFFVIGLLIGAAIAETILGAIAAIIVLAVLLALLLILTLILILCDKQKIKKYKCEICR